jgi:hypothetical protein
MNDCTLYDFLCGLVVNFMKVSSKSLSYRLILYICDLLNDDMDNWMIYIPSGGRMMNDELLRVCKLQAAI